MNFESQVKVIFSAILIGLLLTVPFLGSSDYLLTIFILAFIFAIVAESWDIINGWCGVFNFAQIAFFAIGGYTSGVIANLFGVPPIIGIWIGGIMASIAAVGIGIPTLRLRGAYIALLTFAFHSFVQSILVSPPMTFITGGSFGIRVPDISIGGWELNLEGYYFLSLGLLILTTFVLLRVVNSSLGMAFQASRDAFEYSRSRGINDVQIRAMAFICGSFFTGVAGALYGHFNGFVDTTLFGWEFTWKTLAMLVVGGLGTLTGPILGAISITFLLEWLRFLGIWRFFMLGGLLWATMVFMRKGMQHVINVFFKLLISLIKIEKKEGT